MIRDAWRKNLLKDLSKTWVVQRLRQIELSAVPGWIGSKVATASRYQHSLSVGKLSLLVSDGDKDEQLLLTAAALLHDVGDGPFPHLSDHLMREILGFSHEGAVSQRHAAFGLHQTPLIPGYRRGDYQRLINQSHASQSDLHTGGDAMLTSKNCSIGHRFIKETDYDTTMDKA